MDAYQLDALLRDFIAGVLRVIEQPHRPDLIPAIEAECRAAAYLVRESMPPEEYEWIQSHVLLYLQIHERIDRGVQTGFMWLIGQSVENDFDSASVARDAARLRDALLGRRPQ